MKEKKQKKIIELPLSTIKILEKLAKAESRSTKNFIETILNNRASMEEKK